MDTKTALLKSMAEEAFMRLRTTPLHREEFSRQHEDHVIVLKFRENSIRFVYDPETNYSVIGDIERKFHDGKLWASLNELRDFRKPGHEMYPWLMALKEAVAELNKLGV